MNPRRPYRAATFAGPRALAVLSCALALLAAQPWRVRGNDLARPAAVHSEAIAQTGKAAVRHAGESAPTIRVAAAVVARREAARVEAQAQFNATWALLQKLLSGELLGANRTVPALIESLDVAYAAPVSIKLCVMPSDDGGHRLWAALSPPPPCERAYAMARCLLAPPC